MEKLEALSSISRLSDHVIRILGQNPGKFTLQGTNTYLVGSQNPYALIDTGQGLPEYVPVLESALKDPDIASPSNPDEPDLSDIVITHRHHDHCGGLPSFPLPPSYSDAHLQSVVDSLEAGSYEPDPTGSPFYDLLDNQLLPTTASPSSAESALHVLHTPGHTPDSICLYFPPDKALFTADTVLGQGTAVFEDLTAYLSSLRKMLTFSPNGPSPDTHTNGIPPYTTIYPGHGPVLKNGPQTISTYINHRLERESQIIAVLRNPPPASATGEVAWTPWTIVKTVYSAYPEPLWAPAAHSVELHLKKLEVDGRVRKIGSGEGRDAGWILVE
ncbi:hypothetical protein JAAARDRAFT_153678 [Jaapia argillacea MUCL 33604]|uniref:Metallo-beta-lactamase domain-containing protein n=1 Tax=Jaapia argillacea MUCL 33604 TaxID=933084 RepID=A0A067QAR7_9AGAM|nr:hypothetical protein JAAARDRAFT_153678 [Jaapia argillacea MUCL 33604]